MKSQSLLIVFLAVLLPLGLGSCGKKNVVLPFEVTCGMDIQGHGACKFKNLDPKIQGSKCADVILKVVETGQEVARTSLCGNEVAGTFSKKVKFDLPVEAISESCTTEHNKFDWKPTCDFEIVQKEPAPK